jgi:hypothetical protein
MNKEIKEIKNFLTVEDFKKLQDSILNIDFPWRKRESMTKTDNNIYFTHSFFNDGFINSDFYYGPLIKPILNKLNCKAVVEVRANMFLNKLFINSGWHIDYDYDNITSILYLNTCNGGTELKINNKIKFIKAEENKMLIFPSKTYHRVCSSTDSDKRFIVNFNYF